MGRFHRRAAASARVRKRGGQVPTQTAEPRRQPAVRRNFPRLEPRVARATPAHKNRVAVGQERCGAAGGAAGVAVAAKRIQGRRRHLLRRRRQRQAAEVPVVAETEGKRGAPSRAVALGRRPGRHSGQHLRRCDAALLEPVAVEYVQGTAAGCDHQPPGVWRPGALPDADPRVRVGRTRPVWLRAADPIDAAVVSAARRQPDPGLQENRHHRTVRRDDQLVGVACDHLLAVLLDRGGQHEHAENPGEKRRRGQEPLGARLSLGPRQVGVFHRSRCEREVGAVQVEAYPLAGRLRRRRRPCLGRGRRALGRQGAGGGQLLRDRLLRRLDRGRRLLRWQFLRRQGQAGAVIGVRIELVLPRVPHRGQLIAAVCVTFYAALFGSPGLYWAPMGYGYASTY